MSDEIPTAKSRRTPTADAAETAAAETAAAVETPVAMAPAVETPVAVAPVVENPMVETPVVETPVTVTPVVETPAAETPVVETPVPETPVVETAAEPVLVAPAQGTATGEVAPVDSAVAPSGSAVAGQVVYVSAPIPPRVRSNRVIGSLLAILGAVIFAALYGAVSALIIDLQSGDLFGPTFGSFLGSAFFWVPGLVFLVGLVLLTLILNRAGWWAHVLGSLVLAIAVYFGMIGVLLLIGNVFHGSPKPITFAQLAVNPWVIAAAIVAREVSIWIGLAIAARGRRVKARNVETRAAFDREQEEKNAGYGQDVAAA